VGEEEEEGHHPGRHNLALVKSKPPSRDGAVRENLWPRGGLRGEEGWLP
jgi:hypothetical protein